MNSKYKYIIPLILFFNQSAKGAENLYLYKGTFSRSIKIEELSQFKLTKKPSNKLKNLIKITGQNEKNLHKFSDILEILKKNNLEILDISTDDGNLEDVFIQLTNN